ncbi:MAG TPA: hypothetical protein VGR87_09100 [Candidatus Limnocylindria bacterium]|nr:hypothetical protein [Candidatus Limnocylindria bacterium]
MSLDGPFFHLEYDIHQPKNLTVTYDADATAGSDLPGFVTSHYQFWAAPNAVLMRKTSGKVRFSVLVAMCPESGRRTRLYRILYPGRDWAVDHEEFQRTRTSYRPKTAKSWRAPGPGNYASTSMRSSMP